jgi:beta-phosphoglucomutase-like phosphatase (HAD superfamily)
MMLLCDADGTLFPSEEPAFEASAVVTNKFLDQLGAGRSFTPTELQAMTNGKNFRASASDFAAAYGRELSDDELERWVAEEKEAVTRHLRTVLEYDEGLVAALSSLAGLFQLAAVTSSATSRLDACLEVTGLTRLFPSERRFSAESSLPRPTSKPDPAIYRFAGEKLGIGTHEGIAIEDSVNGALSAVAAGFRTVGTVQFVPVDERPARVAALREAGVVAVMDDWTDLLPVDSVVAS